MQPVRARWAGWSFLLYAGGIAIVLATLSLLLVIGVEHSQPAFVALAGLVTCLLAFLSAGASFGGRPHAAGLFGLSATVSFIVFVGAVLNWFGWLRLVTKDSAFAGFHLGDLLFELVALVAALVALRLLRFPLFVLLATVSAWFFVTDLLSNGGNWSTTVTLLFGLVALLVGLGVDRVYGFWVHVVAGLTMGGALLTFWHSGDFEWILIALASLVFVLLASGLDRSSYAVLAAIGLFLTTTHFASKWFVPPVTLFDEGSSTAVHPWAAVLSYAVYGLGLMLLGALLALRRGVGETA